MRRDFWITALVSLSTIGSFSPAEAVQTPKAPTVTILSVAPGAGETGRNRYRATVRNDGAEPFPFVLSLRTESASRGWQRGLYRMLAPGEIADVEMEYEVPDRGYRLLVAYFGRAERMPTEETPYPGFDAFAEQRHALRPAEAGAPPRFWRRAPHAPIPREHSADGPMATELAGLLDWARPTADDVAPEILGEATIGDYRVIDVRIATEPDATIDFLLVRRNDREGPLSTALYLPGNPPGTKRSGLVSAMSLADAGLQVAAVERRESARETEAGEFLSSRADPVFDAGRVVDHLLSRDDVAGEEIGVFGFSLGAYEGMLLTALHPDVGAAALASRMAVDDSLFGSPGWIPTLWSVEVLEDVGLARHIGDWEALWGGATPAVGAAALEAYRARYPYFDRLDPAAIVPGLAPVPVLVVAGARDPQFPLSAVLALDALALAAYREAGVEERSELYVMPRGGHTLTPRAMDVIADWLRIWLEEGSPGEP